MFEKLPRSCEICLRFVDSLSLRLSYNWDNFILFAKRSNFTRLSTREEKCHVSYRLVKSGAFQYLNNWSHLQNDLTFSGLSTKKKISLLSWYLSLNLNHFISFKKRFNFFRFVDKRRDVPRLHALLSQTSFGWLSLSTVATNCHAGY